VHLGGGGRHSPLGAGAGYGSDGGVDKHGCVEVMLQRLVEVQVGCLNVEFRRNST